MKRIAGIFCCSLLGFILPPLSHADCWNPLQNPSFEASLVPDQNQYDQVLHWTLDGGMRAVVYGSPGSLSSTPPSEDAWGSTYFDGGFSDLAIATQRIEVPAECENLYDANYYYFFLEARFGDVAGEPDYGGIQARFLDAADHDLGGSIEFSVPDGSGTSITKSYSTGQLIPVGTRAVEISVKLVNVNGGRNTAWADNIFVALTWPDPVEPTSWGAIKARFK